MDKNHFSPYYPILRIKPTEWLLYIKLCHLKAITRPVLDRFQDSSKTGSGINFFPPFLPPFCRLFCHLFADFFGTAFLRAVQKTRYFEYAVQKSGGEGVCVCRKSLLGQHAAVKNIFSMRYNICLKS
jgi:hypothetical protein